MKYNLKGIEISELQLNGSKFNFSIDEVSVECSVEESLAAIKEFSELAKLFASMNSKKAAPAFDLRTATNCIIKCAAMAGKGDILGADSEGGITSIVDGTHLHATYSKKAQFTVVITIRDEKSGLELSTVYAKDASVSTNVASVESVLSRFL